MTAHDLIVTTAFGLEAVVRRELEQLGYSARVVTPGRLQFSGGAEAIVRCNLWLRTADRVLIQLGEFDAPDFDALFESTRELAWDAWIPPDGEFPVVGRSRNSTLTSVPACQRAVKKAIVERLQSAHQTDTLPETGGRYRIEVALLNDRATLTLDTTGASLHKRGYRLQHAAAPLKETLAAAMVMLSFWKPDRPLIDPFCGSGTIPIEAAMVGHRIAPGLQREFPAESWPTLDRSLWQSAREAAKAEILTDDHEKIIGQDIDERPLRAARENARRAGVESQIHFQCRAFEQLSSRRSYGCLITNPPYGERMGEQRELEDLYRSIPMVLRKLPTWSHYVLTSYPQFEQRVGRTADRRRKLYNGRIECTYYQFHGPRPGAVAETTPEREKEDGEGAVQEKAEIRPVFGGLTAKAHEQAELFRRRLTKRARHLRRWPTRQGITCFRLYERDIPEIPLVVDRYEDSLHLSEYDRPHDRDPGQHADWLDLMARVAGETLEVAPNRVHLKRRHRQRGSAQHERQGDERHEEVVHEAGLKFLVNLSDYVDTGLFLDHRVTRGMVRDESDGKRFLNLFGYTGAFTVYAAAGGASETTTVDWSHTYLAWARRNLELNGFDGPEHHFVRTDARSFLQGLPTATRFDLAVVDPPTFSNSKRTELVWDVQRDYAELLNRLIPHLDDGGVIYFSTNFRRFKFDEQAIEGVTIREISAQTVPQDFRNRRIHRCWWLQKA